MENDVSVQYPVHKAVTAIGTSAGSVGVSRMIDLSQFMPHTLVDWMAFLASFLACIYSFCLLTEWWWKRFWRPFFQRRKERPRARTVTTR